MGSGFVRLETTDRTDGSDSEDETSPARDLCGRFRISAPIRTEGP